MRTSFVILAGSLLVACGGTRVVYVPAPSSTPAPVAKTMPAPRVIPAPMPPVAVTIARVDDNRLLVSTNQPAYLAVFEIVPNRGVTLVYPASPRHRQVALTGSNWVSLARWASRDDYDRYARDDRRDRYDRVARPYRRGPMERHVYAIASDRPLRLTDDAFNDDYLRNVVGTRAYRDDEPYEAMSALALRFVPPGREEQWGEDLYTMDIARPSVVVRVAKIYCPDGSVIYVRDEMADRASCPWRGRVGTASAPPPARPDSVIASNGRPVGRGPDPRTTQPLIFRIPRPVDAPVVEQAGRRAPDPVPTDRVYGRPVKTDSTRDSDDGKGKPGKDHQDNGNHYGWDKGNRGNGGNGNSDDANDKDKKNKNGDNQGNQGNNGNNGNNGNQQGALRPPRPLWAPKVQVKPSEPEHRGGQVESKPTQQPDAKPDVKPDNKPEQKPDAKPDVKPDNKPDVKPDNKPDNKPEAKPQPNGDAEHASEGQKDERDVKNEKKAKPQPVTPDSTDESSDKKPKKGKPQQ
ncbi:MAG: hypothetical protein M3Z10_01195 [Gemmatimonadota bacterium]|nr:hypothetical protein [Gemmatimonadota bacterium]